MAQTILIIEDELDVSNLVRYHLAKAGFIVLTASNGVQGLDLVREKHPDLIILDLMLPGMDGFDICQAIRADAEIASTGILILTAKGESQCRVEGLELGADDYVTKPFSPRELVLRAQAVLRRLTAREKDLIETIGDFTINRSTLEIFLEGDNLGLTTLEFKLLSLLIERRGKVQSRDSLLSEVWGYKNFMDTRTVDTHIRRLREKLGNCAERLETIRGEGYLYHL